MPVVLAFALGNTHAQHAILPTLTATIPLQGVKGRIDHMAIDVKTERIFVAALGNNTVEVVSLKQGKRMRSLSGFTEPQGVLYDAASNRLYVTNGGEGSCAILDASSLKILKTIPKMEDADNIRYDKSARLLYVGYGDGGLAVIDPRTMQNIFEIPFDQHPESFQLEKGSNVVYVNVPNGHNIIVIDRAKRTMLKSWATQGAEENFPMALDETDHLLFVGFRSPPSLQVLDTRSGNVVESVPIGTDVDDLFFDVRSRRIFASCGGGRIDIISVGEPTALKLVGTVPTRQGARTSLLVPELNILIVAAPKVSNTQAELRVYTLVQ